MYSFQPAQVRAALQPLNLENPRPSSPRLDDCCAYYGIDFERRLQGVTRNTGYFECAGARIAAHVYRPAGVSRGSVFLLHGYYDHVGLYGNPIRWCLEHDLNVMAWDLPGHGLSSGPRATIESFDDYVETLESALMLADGHLPQPWHCMGQSTGGAVAMEYLLSRGFTVEHAPFQQIVLFAPLVRPAGWSTGRIAYRLANRFIDELPRKFMRNSENEAFLEFLKHHDPLQPRSLSVQWVGAMREWMKRFLTYPKSPLSPLVIQGIGDRTVDWRYNLRVIRDKFTDPEVFYLGHARHHLVNESRANRERIFRRIEQRFGFDVDAAPDSAAS